MVLPTTRTMNLLSADFTEKHLHKWYFVVANCDETKGAVEKPVSIDMIKITADTAVQCPNDQSGGDGKKGGYIGGVVFLVLLNVCLIGAAGFLYYKMFYAGSGGGSSSYASGGYQLEANGSE